MDATAPTGFVEQFHLLFLAQLARRVKPALFVLKGGCNLRFFHGSIRYSEDMDLDLGQIGAEVFRDKVREISPPARSHRSSRPGASPSSAFRSPSRPTRPSGGSWVCASMAPLFRFRRRSSARVEAWMTAWRWERRPGLARAYRLPPFMVNHYDAAAALRQKIGALAGRRKTQARDVFDLHHLLAGGAGLRATPGPGGDVVERARANALSVDFGTFKSQVLAYLEPEAQAQYDSPSAWDTIVLEVVGALRGTAS